MRCVYDTTRIAERKITMAQATITITADVDTIRRILGVLDDGGAGEPTDAALRRFIGSLTEGCRQVVVHIAANSRSGDPTTRLALMQGVAMENGQNPDDEQLNGLLGAIGVRWRGAGFERNPFRPLPGRSGQSLEYQIDSDLAEQILEVTTPELQR
jgi:hypothetical protein